MSAHLRRVGFTLVELLVVIAIIGILVALLLPAIQAARESARRSECGSKLRQLGMAVHNYHDVHTRLPAGYIYNGTAGDPEWGWPVAIFPFLELASLYDQFDPGRSRLKQYYYSGAPATTQTLCQTPLPAFRCPSDIAKETNGLANAPMAMPSRCHEMR